MSFNFSASLIFKRIFKKKFSQFIPMFHLLQILPVLYLPNFEDALNQVSFFSGLIVFFNEFPFLSNCKTFKHHFGHILTLGITCLSMLNLHYLRYFS